MVTNISTVTLTDNTELVQQASDELIQLALERVGQFVENEAKLELAKDPPRIDTGALRNSITHTVKKRMVIIGTNFSYAVFVHEGTGKYNSSGSTGDKYWVYVVGGNNGHSHRVSGKRYTYEEAKRIVAMMKAKGLDAHMTNGMKPNRFLRNAIMNNLDKIKADFENTLKGN